MGSVRVGGNGQWEVEGRWGWGGLGAMVNGRLRGDGECEGLGQMCNKRLWGDGEFK